MSRRNVDRSRDLVVGKYDSLCDAEVLEAAAGTDMEEDGDVATAVGVGVGVAAADNLLLCVVTDHEDTSEDEARGPDNGEDIGLRLHC